MKIKHDFVTNSSSSSFFISRHWLSDVQIDIIKNHIIIASHLPTGYAWLDRWDIEVTDGEVKGYTSMDNFDMEKFLTEEVGVDDSHIFWSEGTY